MIGQIVPAGLSMVRGMTAVERAETKEFKLEDEVVETESLVKLDVRDQNF